MRQLQWSPISGCSKVDAGCANCAPFVLGHPCFLRPELWGVDSITKDGQWTGRIHFNEDELTRLFSLRVKGSVVWTAQMGDLWHPAVTDEQRHRIFGVMASLPQHLFVVTTKRLKEASQWLTVGSRPRLVREAAREFQRFPIACPPGPWPLPNLCLGASVCNQSELNKQAGVLKLAPVTMRVLWIAPILGVINLTGWDDTVDWVVVRCEEIKRSQALRPAWVVGVKNWCVARQIPFHFRGWGEDIDSSTNAALLNAARGDIPTDALPKDIRLRVGGELWQQSPL